MAKVYYNKDIKTKILKNKTIAIIGFGSQGHAHALNLRDSGYKVIIGALKNSKSWKLAEKTYKFKVFTTQEAVRKAEVIMVLVPDMPMPEIYQNQIEPFLKKQAYLGFAHGFNIHYKFIKPKKDINVFMVAPKGPGHRVREVFLNGSGVPALVAIYQDPSKNTLKLALEYSKGLGAGRVGILKTTFKEETETDLFGEQVVLCGGLTKLIQKAFETLVEAGYKPEIAYFECLNELKLIIDLIYEKGITKMRESISDTAEWGDYISGKRIITNQTKKEMKRILKEIQSGKFAKEWRKEYKSGLKNFYKLRKKEANHLIEKIGKRIRKMMQL